MSEYQCECAECAGDDEWYTDGEVWDDEPYLPVDVYDQAPAPTGIRATLAAMGKLGTVSGGPIPGAGPCPRCKGEYPPYYRHACVSGGAQRTPDGNNALDGPLRAAEGEPVPDIPFIEFDMPACRCGCHAWDGVPHRQRCKACGHNGPVPDETGDGDDWPIPDDDPDEWVPDETGTPTAPADCTCGNPSRYMIPPPCPAHSGVVREQSAWLDGLDRL